MLLVRIGLKLLLVIKRFVHRTKKPPDNPCKKIFTSFLSPLSRKNASFDYVLARNSSSNIRKNLLAAAFGTLKFNKTTDELMKKIDKE